MAVLLAIAIAAALPPVLEAQEADGRRPGQTRTRPDGSAPALRSLDTSHAAGIQGTSGGGQLDLWVDRAQRWFDPERQGFFPWIGSIMPGGWLAGGGGYRQELVRGIRVDALGGLSLRNYKLLAAGVSVPVTGDDRVTLDVRTRLMDAPRVHLFGVGNESLEEDRSRFDFEPKRVDVTLRVRPRDGVEVGGGFGWLGIHTGPGPGDRSATERFSPANVPGLGDEARYRTLGLFAQVDRRDARDFTRRGGWYRVDWTAFLDGDERPYGHHRVDVDARRFFPIIGDRHALFGRVLFTATAAGDADDVPHFLMPVLGDGDNLRGYANQRFVDRQRLLLQSEYRYRVTDRLYTAGFLDLGRVGHDLGDLGLRGLHPTVGAGVRLQMPDGFGVRVDVARSSEQWAFIVSSVVF